MCRMQAMRQVADVIHAVARRVAIFDRKRKQDEATRLQGLWLRWELSTFEYLMRVRPGPQSLRSHAAAGLAAALGDLHLGVSHAAVNFERGPEISPNPRPDPSPDTASKPQAVRALGPGL